MEVRVKAPETVEPAQTEPEPSRIRDQDVPVVADDNGNHLAFSAHQERNLSLNVERNGAKLAGQFMGDDVVTGYAAPVKVLEKFDLAGL